MCAHLRHDFVGLLLVLFRLNNKQLLARKMAEPQLKLLGVPSACFVREEAEGHVAKRVVMLCSLLFGGQALFFSR